MILENYKIKQKITVTKSSTKKIYNNKGYNSNQHTKKRDQDNHGADLVK